MVATHAGADSAHTEADGTTALTEADGAAICEPCAGADATPLAGAERRA